MILVLLMHLEVGLTRDPINIYWNSSNPIFSSTSPSIEVNRDTGPWQFDQINLICPTGPRVTEQHIIYSVSQDEFEACEVWSPAPKIVAVCDKPTNFLYFTITFRYFSPSPRQLEFKPGETYFFVSTSSRTNLESREGGFCSSHNMKMQFRIAESPVEAKIPKSLLRNLPVPTAFWSKYWRSRVPDTRDLYNTNYEDDYRDIEQLRGNLLPYKSSADNARFKSVVATLILLVIYM